MINWNLTSIEKALKLIYKLSNMYAINKRMMCLYKQRGCIILLNKRKSINTEMVNTTSRLRPMARFTQNCSQHEKLIWSYVDVCRWPGAPWPLFTSCNYISNMVI